MIHIRVVFHWTYASFSSITDQPTQQAVLVSYLLVTVGDKIVGPNSKDEDWNNQEKSAEDHSPRVLISSN
jgi:hypothetical protein